MVTVDKECYENAFLQHFFQTGKMNAFFCHKHVRQGKFFVAYVFL